MSDPTIVQVGVADGFEQWMLDDVLLENNEQLGEIPSLYRDAVVTHPDVAQWVRDLVKMSAASMAASVRQGPSLLLTGPVGTGKTYAAWGAVRALMVSGVRCRFRFRSVTRWFLDQEVGSGYEPSEVFEEACRARLLVLDDLGASKPSGRREELLTELINERLVNQLPTLVTTNVGSRPGESLGNVVGDRVASRLAQLCTVAAFTGPDRRRVGNVQ